MTAYHFRIRRDIAGECRVQFRNAVSAPIEDDTHDTS